VSVLFVDDIDDDDDEEAVYIEREFENLSIAGLRRLGNHLGLDVILVKMKSRNYRKYSLHHVPADRPYVSLSSSDKDEADLRRVRDIVRMIVFGTNISSISDRGEDLHTLIYSALEMTTHRVADYVGNYKTFFRNVRIRRANFSVRQGNNPNLY